MLFFCRVSRLESLFFALAKKRILTSVQSLIALCLCGEEMEISRNWKKIQIFVTISCVLYSRLFFILEIKLFLVLSQIDVHALKNVRKRCLVSCANTSGSFLL
jgi:hypothetical protein